MKIIFYYALKSIPKKNKFATINKTKRKENKIVLNNKNNNNKRNKKSK